MTDLEQSGQGQDIRKTRQIYFRLPNRTRIFRKYSQEWGGWFSGVSRPRNNKQCHTGAPGAPNQSPPGCSVRGHGDAPNTARLLIFCSHSTAAASFSLPAVPRGAGSRWGLRSALVPPGCLLPPRGTRRGGPSAVIPVRKLAVLIYNNTRGGPRGSVISCAINPSSRLLLPNNQALL